MNKKERAELIARLLHQHIPHPIIPLRFTTPFTLLIAVLLSAQCTDERINQITPQLFALASTPDAMVRLSLSTLENIIRPCGLFRSKAKHILQLSRELLKKHQGAVPHTFSELEALPGVGHKTASVVLAQAFHLPTFPVDTHIHRCAKRWGLSQARTVKQTEKDLKKLFPKKMWNTLHLQIILFAKTYCPARGHQSAHCPICSALPKD